MSGETFTREPKRCRACRAPIFWKSTPNDERMPLDLTPTLAIGSGVYVQDETNSAKIRPYSPLFDGLDHVRYMNHWATCPNVDLFKPKRKDVE